VRCPGGRQSLLLLLLLLLAPTTSAVLRCLLRGAGAWRQGRWWVSHVQRAHALSSDNPTDPPGRPMLPATCVLLRLDSVPAVAAAGSRADGVSALREQLQQLLTLNTRPTLATPHAQHPPVNGSAGTVPAAAGAPGPAETAAAWGAAAAAPAAATGAPPIAGTTASTTVSFRSGGT
jgi:hypothetical protein